MREIERPLRVAVVGRSVYALHGFGGLERHLYDLVRHHLAEGWEVTLVTRTAKRPSGLAPDRWVPVATHPTPLITAESRHRGSRKRKWCTTIPAWLNVNPVNTPMA